LNGLQLYYDNLNSDAAFIAAFTALAEALLGPSREQQPGVDSGDGAPKQRLEATCRALATLDRIAVEGQMPPDAHSPTPRPRGTPRPVGCLCHRVVSAVTPITETPQP